jgi:hypothetical protein
LTTSPAAPSTPPTTPSADRLAAIAELDPEALAALTNVIDALITKTRLRVLTDDIG